MLSLIVTFHEVLVAKISDGLVEPQRQSTIYVILLGFPKISGWWRVRSERGGLHASMSLTKRMGLRDAGSKAKLYKHGASV